MAEATAHTDVVRWMRRACVLVIALPVIGACGASESADDCNARIRFQGVVYRPNTGLPAEASAGAAIGTGEVVGCGDGLSVPAIEQVDLVTVEGVDTQTAVLIERGEYRGVYVNQELDRSEWPDALTGDQRAGSGTSPQEQGRLDVRPEAGPDITPLPPRFQPIASELAELVDFEEQHFSGSWFDAAKQRVVIGVASEQGLSILQRRGLASDPQVEVRRVRWSARESHDILFAYEQRSILKDRFVIWGTLPEGNGFYFKITGDDLSEAERTDLLTLPGRIDVGTGMP